jgi:hypothetical protein
MQDFILGYLLLMFMHILLLVLLKPSLKVGKEKKVFFNGKFDLQYHNFTILFIYINYS